MSLLEISKKINNLKNINKISHVLFLSSLVKIKKYKRELEENEPFYLKIKEIFNIINHGIYNICQKSDKKLFIIITSNDGFCGNYNKNIFDYINKNIPYNKYNNIMPIGLKGFNFLKKFDYVIHDKFVNFSNNDLLFLAKEISFFIINNKFKEVHIVLSENSNLTMNKVKEMTVLPICNNSERDLECYDNYILEPNKKEIFLKSIPFYLTNNIYRLLLSANISEQTIRMQNMQEAKKNTEEALEKLINKYNKLRHAKITQEILETASSRCKDRR